MGKQLDTAKELHRSGRLAEAEKIYESLYRRGQSDADVALHLGLVRLSLGRNEAAIQPLRRAARLAPRNTEAHYALGEAFDRLGMAGDAVEFYRAAVALRPEEARLQLALGGALLASHDPTAALTAFDAAIAAEPSLAHAHNNAGLALKSLGRFGEAAARFAAAMAISPRYAACAFNLGKMLSEQGEMAQAEPWLKKAAELAPDLVNARLALADLLRETGRHQESKALIEGALEQGPDDPVALVWRCVFELPVLYGDQSEIETCRARYSARLSELLPRVRQDPKRFLPGFATTRPFLLAYQGKGDRDLQTLYGSMLEAAVGASVASSGPSKPSRRGRTGGRKARLGVVSGYFYSHSVWKIPTRGWLLSVDRELFEVFCYHTSGYVDEQTGFARQWTDDFVQGPLSLRQWAERIGQDGCDILLYPEIGIDAMCVQLAALRRAPVQGNGLGHPVTSGLSAIDVALSSALMEPPLAEAHYSERLLRLPNLGVYYQPLEAPLRPAARDSLGLSEEDFVFWCPQSLFKYLPAFDEIYPMIAAEAPNARFLFIDYHVGGAATAIFAQRLERRFSDAGLVMQRHCKFLPRLSQAQFVATAGLCDAMLDSIEWSGFNSTLESLAHDLPLVSFSGTFMRGRHSAAILQRIGMDELVADSIDGFVGIARRLAKDPAYRADVKGRIASAKPVLFEDRAYAERFNATLLDLLTQHTPGLTIRPPPG